MNGDYQGVKCSAVNKDGRPCRAWAMVGSEPALCSVHAGRNKGKGAKAGNRNALKHGYYAKAIRGKVRVDEIEEMQACSLLGELVVARIMLRELVAYLLREDLRPEERMAVVPLINSTIRTVTYVAGRLEEISIDWDEVLDDLGEEWGMDL